MKWAGYIFVFSFFFSLAQPLTFLVFPGQHVEMCADLCPDKADHHQEHNDSENHQCNPFLSCGHFSGYMLFSAISEIPPLAFVPVDYTRAEENFLSNFYLTFWHPPKIS
jgi:hypothetical protein